MSGVSDGTSNTILFGETAPGGTTSPGTGGGAAGITDGTSNTIIVTEEGAIFHPGRRRVGSGSTASITDGTSNTILFGESPAAGSPSGGSTSGRGSSITDGTSNTILFGESPAPAGGTGGTAGSGSSITDGTSNTVIFGEAAARPGEPLPPFVREKLRGKANPFYLSFVRVRSGPELLAARLPAGARAVVGGRDLFFAPGAYDPYRAAGLAFLLRVLAYGARIHTPWARFKWGFWSRRELGF